MPMACVNLVRDAERRVRDGSAAAHARVDTSGSGGSPYPGYRTARKGLLQPDTSAKGPFLSARAPGTRPMIVATLQKLGHRRARRPQLLKS